MAVERIVACPRCGSAARSGALDAAWDLVKGWSMEERETLRSSVPKLALDAPIAGGRLGDIAGEVLAIARAGLKSRARLNADGTDETRYLDPLDEIVASGKVPAQLWLDRYHGEWGGDLSRVYDEASF
jgi:glutamate--cysteine ligase